MKTKEIREMDTLLAQQQEILHTTIKDHLEASGQQGLFDKVSQYQMVGDNRIADLAGEMDLAIFQRELQELDDLAAARKRIADGTYGICIDCGSPIGAARLHVFATAKRCLACQSARETRVTGRRSL